MTNPQIIRYNLSMRADHNRCAHLNFLYDLGSKPKADFPAFSGCGYFCFRKHGHTSAIKIAFVLNLGTLLGFDQHLSGAMARIGVKPKKVVNTVQTR
jgi:hypothetical protein